MDVVARFFRTQRSAFFVGTAAALLVLAAIFAFGAPAWILVPAVWVGATVHAKAQPWADRRLGSR